MKIKVYVDESGTHDKTGQANGSAVPVVGGYFASTEFWNVFNKNWQSVLDSYKAPYFHAKELGFHQRKNPKNPYHGWSDDRVDDFRYDLSIVAGSGAIPVGGFVGAKQAYDSGMQIEPYEIAFKLFFNDLCEALNARKLIGIDEFIFVFDSNQNTEWKSQLASVHKLFKSNNPNFGVLAYEDDKDPTHMGLQAADLYVSSTRRQAVTFAESGKTLQPRRIIDLILNRFLREDGHPWSLSGIPAPAFQIMIHWFREHERQKRREWKNLGLKNQIYYPEQHFPFEKYGIKVPNGTVD